MKEKVNRSIRVTKYVVYKETSFNYKEGFWSFIGAFFGIGLIAFIQSFYLSDVENVFLIGSFGASCVLIYGAVQSPLAQPRNLIGGHVLSAFVGVTVYNLVPNIIWIAAPLAVSLSIIVMQCTKTLHPPGGATALIVIIGTEKIKSLSYMYVLSPVLTGTLILFLVALVANNMNKNRVYPSSGKYVNGVRKRILKIGS
ncbi:HPP family protein [Polaribacter staleyi]|uniref:HPP family protein n=1 Tax=Polaribacter staleyi TaxID=2022337 RepID=UPI0031BA882A